MRQAGVRAIILAPVVIVGAMVAPATASHDSCHRGDDGVLSIVGGLVSTLDDSTGLGLCDLGVLPPPPSPTPTPTPSESDTPRPTAGTRDGTGSQPRSAGSRSDGRAPASGTTPRAAGAPAATGQAPPATTIEAPPSGDDPIPSADEPARAGSVTPWALGALLAGVLGGILLGRSSSQARARRDAQRELASALGAMRDGVLVTDPSRRVRSMNQAAATLVGVGPKEGRGRPISAVLAGSTECGTWLPTWIRETSEARATSATLDHETTPVAVSIAPGTEGQWVIILRDLRPERAVEKMKHEFLSNVGHELRTPLTSALGFARILRDRELSREQERTFVDAVVNACEKLDRVVDLLIDVATIEGGVASVGSDPVRVDRIVGEVAQRWQTSATGHIITARVSGRLPPARGNEALLRHALHELVDNAVKFSPDGGMITVGARLERAANGRELRIEVSDQGVGIESGKIERIFGDFSQGDGSETREFGGLGLGLAFVRRVARMHGGDVTLTSQPGSGTTVGLTLPVPVPSRRIRIARDLARR